MGYSRGSVVACCSPGDRRRSGHVRAQSPLSSMLLSSMLLSSTLLSSTLLSSTLLSSTLLSPEESPPSPLSLRMYWSNCSADCSPAASSFWALCCSSATPAARAGRTHSTSCRTSTGPAPASPRRCSERSRSPHRRSERSRSPRPRSSRSPAACTPSRHRRSSAPGRCTVRSAQLTHHAQRWCSSAV